jgi:hypothetical protein
MPFHTECLKSQQVFPQQILSIIGLWNSFPSVNSTNLASCFGKKLPNFGYKKFEEKKTPDSDSPPALNLKASMSFNGV